ncbi:MAG: alpha/beta hydrolase [Clostridia bacterium]|nr:alpha/beta hydrolase [Clostridia bacterium]
MKKLLSLLLCVCMLLSLPTAAFAKTSCNCGHSPVIYVRGFGGPLYNTETGKRIYEPAKEDYKKAAPYIAGAAVALLCRSYPLFCTLGMKAAMMLLGEIACDETGTPLYPTNAHESLPTTDVHGKYQREIADYVFDYDWRLDPFDTAENLHTYVERVKSLTGHTKVSFVAHSMGSVMLATYLSEYGSDDVDAAVCLAPAFGGVTIMGSLLSGEADISDKSEELANFLLSVPALSDSRLQLLVRVCRKLRLFPPILRWLQGSLDSQFDRAFHECLGPLFAQMPGIWSFVTDEYYERAKAFCFGGDAKYDELIRKIDRYHYEVQANLRKLLDDAQQNGMRLAIVSGYGISSMPLSRAHTQQSDFLITTKCSSLGAYSEPFGQSLPEGYTQAVQDGHDHISPDRLVDASACAYPERTWFIHSLMHFDFPYKNTAFIRWLVEQPAETTVFTNPEYPQFLLQDGHELRPVTE